MPPHKSSNIKPSIEEALNEGVTYDPDIVRLEPGQAFIDRTGVVRPEPASNAYGMDFGDAIRCLKRGQRVQRHGWNGKGMFVYYVPANSYPAQTGAAKAFFGENALVPHNAYLALKGADGAVSTWAPSGSDALADDWRVVA